MHCEIAVLLVQLVKGDPDDLNPQSLCHYFQTVHEDSSLGPPDSEQEGTVTVHNISNFTLSDSALKVPTHVRVWLASPAGIGFQ
jgi:hypothetical protein